MHQGLCWERREGLLGRLGHQEMHRGLCRGRREGLQGHLGLLGMHQGLCRERREGLLGRLGHQEMHRGLCRGRREGLQTWGSWGCTRDCAEAGGPPGGDCAKCLGMRQKLGRCCCLGCCLGTRQILG